MVCASRPADTAPMDHDSHDDEAPTVAGGPASDADPTRSQADADPTRPSAEADPTLTQAAAGSGEPPLVRAARQAPRDTFRILLWTLRLGITLVMAALFAYLGVMLAVFGLAGVALLAALLLIGVSAVTWRRGMLPAAVLAAALALPSAEAVLETARFDRSFGTLIVRPGTPQDLIGERLVRGFGSVLVDLRSFRAPAGSVTEFSARADNGRVVVALPRGRCFNLEVRVGSPGTDAFGARELVQEGGRLLGATLNTGTGQTMAASTLLTSRASEIENLRNADFQQQTLMSGRPDSTYALSLFGRVPLTGGVVRRVASGQPDAPTLRLTLRSSGQVVVRDYPESAAPLLEPGSGGQQVADMSWPAGVQPPPAPGEIGYRYRPGIRTPANRARWITWERKMVAWGIAQAKRGAGACASREELAQRGTQFEIQPEAVPGAGGRTSVAVGVAGAKHSSIPQRATTERGRLIRVEVNGLGELRQLGQTDDPHADTSDDSGANG